MNASRFGTHLKIDIRIALKSLGRDPFDKKIDRMTIAELKQLFASLRAEQRAVGGILKAGV